MKNNTKVAVISLGCDKNRVDTETMLYQIDKAGFVVSQNEEDFDVVIINTCAFIDPAKQEGIDNILDMVEIKNQRDIKIIVSGCMGERYANDLFEQIPEIDCVMGYLDYQKIGLIINKVMNNERFIFNEKLDKPTTDRIITTPYHYAYLKIAEGCDNHCTYCAIPKIRGKFRSREIGSLVDETKKLIDTNNTKELILVAQDVSRYGIDLYDKKSLISLLEELSKLDIEWIRMLYLYPEMVDEELIKYVVENPKVCRYFDIPMQHIDSDILKKMNRRTTEKEIKSLINTIRKYDENCAIRSTFITGFPTETEVQHENLKKFISEYKLDFAGFFAYSKEDGTSASKMKGQILEDIKLKRQAELEKIQNKVMEEKSKSKIGKTLKVLYDNVDYDIQQFVGRSEFNAPDIDSQVLLNSENVLEIGNFYNAKIVGTNGIDLIGEIDE